MQPIAPVTSDQLLAPGQKPLSKLELFFKNSWVNICNLFSSVGLVGWWAFDEGAGIVAYDHSKYGNDGTLYPTPVPISPCDAVTDWTGTDLSIDTDDKKEGSGSLKDDVASPVATTTYITLYNPAGSWDWSAKKHILLWLKSDRANTAFTVARLVIADTSTNWRQWNLTFSAGEWTAVKKLLSTGDAESGTPPDLALIEKVYITFQAEDTTAFYKKIDDLRIDDRPQWVNGKVGKALDFDGDNDYIDLGSSVLNQATYALSFWIKDYVEDTNDFIFGEATNKNFLLNYAPGSIAFRESDGTYHTFVNNSVIEDAGWHHVVFTSDGTDISLYVDGVYQEKVTPTSTLFLMRYINGGYAAADYFVQCKLDEVLIYNRALLEGEIKALFELKGKNYVEGVSVSLGGASMTPNPVGGAWSAMLGNENSIFHPKHPTSAYKDYCVTGRKARISIGATYGGTDYYWQRMIGFMDEPKFSAPDYKVAISGGDYMKLLQETELRSPDNYWGTSAVFSSIASDGQVGSEIYNEVDAMEIGAGEANNVTNWTAVESTFVSFADTGGGSTYVGRVTNITPLTFAYVKNLNVGNATAGKEYKVKFKHRGVGEDGESASIQVRIYQASGLCNRKTYYPTDDWTEDVLYFTALDTGAIEMWVVYTPGFSDLRLDQFSIWEFVSYWKRYYELPVASKGPYYVTLDGLPVWQGEKDEGWYYAEDAEPGPDPPAHPARIVYFDPNKVVTNGTNNLVIYYFTTESPENAVARLLFKAGLYASEAAALAAMDYSATGITIDKIWFEAGTTCLNAIKKLCERCDYRFFFNYDGKPVFKPKPAPGATSFTFTEQKHIASAVSYQCRDEIKNRIVIEGMKQAEPVNKEETIPPELKGEDFDSTSIGLYGERTLTIKNHLFQSQASIDAMCTSLLAEYKDPKLYADIEVPFRPVPLELSDKISFKERLSPTLEITQEGIIRDIKIDNFNTTYRCEI